MLYFLTGSYTNSFIGAKKAISVLTPYCESKLSVLDKNIFRSPVGNKKTEDLSDFEINMSLSEIKKKLLKKTGRCQ